VIVVQRCALRMSSVVQWFVDVDSDAAKWDFGGSSKTTTVRHILRNLGISILTAFGVSFRDRSRRMPPTVGVR